MLTAMAIVPEEVIRMNVIIAIRISGMGAPPNDSANTSLGTGHGSVVEIRTDM